MKRFNYTGRKKIVREDISVRLQGRFSEPPVVDAVVTLNEYDFPVESKVFLEVQRQTRYMRIELIRHGASARGSALSLSEFDDADGLTFRIRVVSPSDGQLLGTADNIKPRDKDDQPDEHQRSILPVRSTDLTAYGVLWRIDFSDQSAVLEIERELGSREQVVRSMLFKGFVLPAAMRQILTHIVTDDWDETLADPDELATRWLLFTHQAGAGLPDPQAEDHENWLDDAVRVLGNRLKIRQPIIEEFTKGVWK